MNDANSGRDHDSDPLIGVALGGYEIERLLGQGGMAKVYRARQATLNRPVALKVLIPNLLGRDELVARFHREARAAGAISHPHLIQIYAFGEEAGTYFYAMELVEGQSLGSFLKQGDRFSEAECIEIGRQTLAALREAHKAGIVHRDIKPENLMLDVQRQIKLGDLGLARVIDLDSDVALTLTGMSLGTPLYIAPEQAQGLRTVDYRADFYAFGATLFHLATGRPPYPGTTAVEVIDKHLNAPIPRARNVNPTLSRPFSDLIERLMAKQPARRPQSHEEIAKELDRSGALLAREFKNDSRIAISMAARIVKPSWMDEPVLWIGMGVAAVAIIAVAVLLPIFSKGPPATEVLGDTEGPMAAIGASVPVMPVAPESATATVPDAPPDGLRPFVSQDACPEPTPVARCGALLASERFNGNKSGDWTLEEGKAELFRGVLMMNADAGGRARIRCKLPQRDFVLELVFANVRLEPKLQFSAYNHPDAKDHRRSEFRIENGYEIRGGITQDMNAPILCSGPCDPTSREFRVVFQKRGTRLALDVNGSLLAADCPDAPADAGNCDLSIFGGTIAVDSIRFWEAEPSEPKEGPRAAAPFRLERPNIRGRVIAFPLYRDASIDDPFGNLPESLRDASDVAAIAACATYWSKSNPPAKGVGLALRGDGRVVGWGSFNREPKVEPPSGLTDAAAVVATMECCGSLTSDGGVVTWGRRDVTPPAGLIGVVRLGYHEVGRAYYAVKADGLVTAFGESSAVALLPADLVDVRDVRAFDLADGQSGVLVLRRDGTVSGTASWSNWDGHPNIAAFLADTGACLLARDGKIVGDPSAIPAALPPIRKIRGRCRSIGYGAPRMRPPVQAAMDREGIWHFIGKDIEVAACERAAAGCIDVAFGNDYAIGLKVDDLNAAMDAEDEQERKLLAMMHAARWPSSSFPEKK